MKFVPKYLLMIAMAFSMAIFTVGCTGPTAVESDSDSETGDMTDEEYSNAMQESMNPPEGEQ